MKTLGRAALWMLTLSAAASNLGCSSTSSCNRTEDMIDVYDGYVNADRTEYTSIDPSKRYAEDGGPADADTLPSYTYFPANRTIVFHIGLVNAPTSVLPYLSFHPEANTTVAPSAGNQSLIRKLTKDEVVLRNDTCSEFWVWLTASTSATPFHPLAEAGEGGSGSELDPSEAAGAFGAP